MYIIEEMQWKRKDYLIWTVNMDEGTYVPAFDSPLEVNAQSGHQSLTKDQWGNSILVSAW